MYFQMQSLNLFSLFLFRRHQESKFTLDQFMRRQRLLLHGYEARHLKHIPKVSISCAVCPRFCLLTLAD